MDKSKILYLIALETVGSISVNDSSELFKAMRSEKDFPWKEMGDYQNLAALLSLVVNEELPAENLKNELLYEIKKIEKRKRNWAIESDLKIKEESELATEWKNPRGENDLLDHEPEEVEVKKEGLKIVDHSSEFEEVKAKRQRLSQE